MGSAGAVHPLLSPVSAAVAEVALDPPKPTPSLWKALWRGAGAEASARSDSPPETLRG